MKEMKVPPPKMTYFVLIQNLSKKMHTTLMKECFGTDFTDWKISASIIRFWKNLGGGGVVTVVVVLVVGWYLDHIKPRIKWSKFIETITLFAPWTSHIYEKIKLSTKLLLLETRKAPELETKVIRGAEFGSPSYLRKPVLQVKAFFVHWRQVEF